MPAESVVPGYRLVESFGPNSEYETRPSANLEGNEEEGEEVEEEVEYVTLEISGIADVGPELLTSYRLIGLDAPTPFLQLSSSGTIFKGRHHKLLGTELLFTHSPGGMGDSDQSARDITLLGTTEKRIVFSPVEIRNPASSKNGSRGETVGKEPSVSSLRKGKKKAGFWAEGIEDVVGAGVSKPPSALDERDGAVESDPGVRGKMAGEKEKGDAPQEDDDDDMYATEEEEGADRGEGTVETDLPPRKKRKPSRGDGEAGGNRSIQSPAATMSAAGGTELGVAQDGVPSTGNGVLVVIDPALEALHVPSEQPPPREAGTGI